MIVGCLARAGVGGSWADGHRRLTVADGWILRMELERVALPWIVLWKTPAVGWLSTGEEDDEDSEMGFNPSRLGVMGCLARKHGDGGVLLVAPWSMEMYLHLDLDGRCLDCWRDGFGKMAAVGGRRLMWADAGSWADGEDAAGPSSAAIDVDD
ncbi:hypothetical protein ACLOJK_019194 [Asimina triloba]